MQEILLKISNYLFKKLQNNISYEEEKKYFMEFEHPKDDIERSYFQHMCRAYKSEILFIYILKNILALFLVLYYLFRIKKPKNNLMICKKKNILMIAQGAERIIQYIPIELKHNFECCYFNDGLSLTKEDRRYIYEIIRRYPKRPLFIVRIIIKIASYRHAISRFNPEQILCSCEYSDTSSVLTLFCEKNNIKHTNFMHGELLFDIVLGFSRFTHFYVWDQEYIDLLSNLGQKSDYIIKLPNDLSKLSCVKFNNSYNIETDYKYYLQLETSDTLRKVKQSVDILRKQGKIIKIRPHPIFTDMNLLETYFESDLIESVSVNIYESILSTTAVISRYSTVNYQAYLLNKTVVIDDIANKQEFSELERRDYIMLRKKVDYLSTLV